MRLRHLKPSALGFAPGVKPLNRGGAAGAGTTVDRQFKSVQLERELIIFMSSSLSGKDELLLYVGTCIMRRINPDE